MCYICIFLYYVFGQILILLLSKALFSSYRYPKMLCILNKNMNYNNYWIHEEGRGDFTDM
jgi:hypothetical protein